MNRKDQVEKHARNAIIVVVILLIALFAIAFGS
jgi:membrane protein involved in colicin uptake